LAVSAPHRRSNGPLVLAAAVPLLFLHVHYQPSVSVGRLDADLSDLAVAAVSVAALLALRGTQRALGSVHSGFLALAALALAVVLGTVWGAHYPGYPTGTHLVSAAKWVEYMLLAPAVVVLARRPRDLLPAAWVAVAWSVVVTAVGVLQFFGALGDLEGTPAGRRKSSLLGYHDFSAFSAAVLVLAFLVVATGTGPRRAALVAGVSGAIGMVIGGAFDAVVGELLAATVILLAFRVRDPRRVAMIGGTVLVVCCGTVAIRSQAVADGLKFLGIKQGTGGASAHVQSYRQRVLLAYIGGRIYLDHPLLGVGFDGSADRFAYERYIADAKRRFDQPAEAFPSPAHPWGVQNAYIQALADLGPLGLLAFLAATLGPAALALRRGRRPEAVAGAALLLVALGVWNGFGLVSGIPLDALTWLAAGVALASVAFVHDSITQRV
jgi:hypothetical protein